MPITNLPPVKIPCPNCNRTATLRNYFMSGVHAFTCHYCDRNFTQKYPINGHIIQKLPDGRIEVIGCNACTGEIP